MGVNKMATVQGADSNTAAGKIIAVRLWYNENEDP